MDKKVLVVLLINLIVGASVLNAGSYIDDLGILIVDGAPFFVMGFFADSYSSSYDSKLETIDSLSAGGFNVIKTSSLAEAWQRDDHFQRAEKANVKLIYDSAQNNEWKDFHLNVMQTCKNKPALLGWYIVDDSHGVPPDTIKMYHDQTKSIDSSHITTHSMALSCWNDYGFGPIRARMDYCDILQMQSYPVGKEPIDEVYHDMRKTLSAVGAGQTADVADLQLFNWQLTGHEWGRWPTPKEAQLMTWLAIVAGVDGYLYYSYYDRLASPSNSLAFTQPELWRAVVQTAKKVNKIRPVLLEHRKFISFSPKANCYYGHWITEEHSTLILINTDPDDSLSVTIPVVRSHDNLTALFDGNIEKLYLEDGYIKGEIGPMSLYSLRLTPSSNSTAKRTENTTDTDFTVYPNPGNSQLTIEFNNKNSKNLRIYIYNIKGQIVKRFQLSNQTTEQLTYNFSKNNMSAGLYFVQMLDGRQVITKKWTYLP